MILTKRVLNPALRPFGYQLQKIKGRTNWPSSHISQLNDSFLLLLTPPNSGSTAIAKFICQSASIVGLTDTCEGDWLIKGLSEVDRWWTEKYVSYSSIAGVWHNVLQGKKESGATIRYVFEKSPPNMVRFHELLKIIPNTRTVINNRNPYAMISSQIKRYGNQFDASDRKGILAHYGKLWLYRANILRNIFERDGIPILTYEAFTHRPTDILPLFGLEGELFEVSATVRVKDYKPQIIMNMNEEQIALLSEEDKDVISSVLTRELTLLHFFGYDLL